LKNSNDLFFFFLHTEEENHALMVKPIQVGVWYCVKFRAH
jgi:hypothetical protein